MKLYMYNLHKLGLRSDGRKWFVVDDYGNLVIVPRPDRYQINN